MRLLVPVLVLLLLPLASAHVPVTEVESEQPVQLPAANGIIVLGELATADDNDVYVFPGKAGQQVNITVLVPELPGLEGFDPSIALFWRRLPDNELQGRQFNYNASQEPKELTDADTGVTFWQRQSVSAQLSFEGTYALVVASEENETGKYALLFGTSSLDPLQAAAAQEKVSQWLGRPALNPFTAAAILLIAAGAAVVAIIVLRSRKPKHVWQRKPWKR